MPCKSSIRYRARRSDAAATTAAWGTLLLLTTWAAGAAAQSPLVTLEGELTLLGDDQDDGVDRSVFLLRTGPASAPLDDGLARLRFSAAAPADLSSGDRLRVRARYILTPPDADAAAAFPEFAVESLTITAPAPGKDFTLDDGRRVVSSITWLVRICNRSALAPVSPNDPAGPMTLQRFRAHWFGGGSDGSRRPNLREYVAGCSFGKVRFDPDRNLIVDLTDEDLGCAGTWQGQAWRADRCGMTELYGWLQVAQARTLARFGIDHRSYAHWILVLPDVAACGWAGLASVGCARNCFLWLRGPYGTNTLSVPMHELGHNLGLNHATTPGAEYGDVSSVMGAGGPGQRCTNAAQAWQLTWAAPVAVWNATSLPEGAWRAATVPALSLDPTNHVQLRPTWATAADLTTSTRTGVFLSLRQRTGWDADVPVADADVVSVHVFNGTQRVGPDKSQLVARIGRGQTWTAPPALNVTVQVLDINATHARVAACRGGPCVPAAPSAGVVHRLRLADRLVDEVAGCDGGAPPVASGGASFVALAGRAGLDVRVNRLGAVANRTLTVPSCVAAAGSFTLAAWVRPIALPPAPPSTIASVLASFGGVKLYVQAGGTLALNRHLANGATQFGAVQGARALRRYAWTHVALVHDAAARTLTLMQDGARDVRADASPPLRNAFPALVVAGDPGLPRAFSGVVSDLVVYRRALADWEVAQVAAAAA